MMDRAEAIKYLDRQHAAFKADYLMHLECGGVPNPRKEHNIELLEIALAALREQKQSNEPLTLEELRNMGGEPVYCADYDLWGIVNIGNYGQWKGKPFIGGYSSNNISFNYDIEMRGLTLFRHKPKEGAEG